MTNSIIIPVLIIIICFIIVYGILSYKYNKKIINTIESFSTNLEINNINKFKSSLTNNIEIISEIANGTWTTDKTTTDINYNANGKIMEIQVNPNTINNLGEIIFKVDNKFVGKSKITSVLNGSISSSGYYDENDKNDPSFNLFIQFIGLTDELTKENIIKEVYYTNTTQMIVVSHFNNNVLMEKFASYKIYNNKLDSSIYGLILSKSFYINNPPAIYDYETYNKIINSYIFPSNNFVSFRFSNNRNPTILNIINNKYLGKITFAIQRLYNSPTGNRIRTNLSNPITIQAINNGNIPDTIRIKPFNEDIRTNNLTSFFRPLGTIVYFYKFQEKTDIKYGYQNNNPIIVNSSVMNFNNNGQSMFNPSIKYNDLNTVYQDNTFKYTIHLLANVSSDKDNDTTINFSRLSNLL
jgi:hypothetical protein